MTQTELAKELNVSKAYISMVLSGKKKPSKRVAERLTELVNFEAGGVTSNPLRGADNVPGGFDSHALPPAVLPPFCQ